MYKKILVGLKLLLLPLFIIGCSKDLDKMTVQERSLYQPARYSKDRASDSYRKPLAILNFSGVKPGMVVIDLLGGGGYYSELFSYIVGEKGKVYIQNNSLFLRFSSKELNERLKDNRLNNVIRLDTEFSDMQLPKNADMIFIGLSYHDIFVPRENPVITANPKQFMLQVNVALKPGGLLVITDHAAKPGTGIDTTPSLHRIDEEWAKRDIQAAGFEFIGSSDFLRNPKDNYELDIWKKKVFHNTDRFVHLYKKQESN